MQQIMTQQLLRFYRTFAVCGASRLEIQISEQIVYVVCRNQSLMRFTFVHHLQLLSNYFHLQYGLEFEYFARYKYRAESSKGQNFQICSFGHKNLHFQL